MNETYEKPEVKPRTAKQRTSLFGTLTEYATKLDDSGYEYTVFIEQAMKKGFKAKWTKDNLHELFNVVSKAMNGGKTSSQLTTKETMETYQVFERHLAECSGVNCVWHSRETEMLKSNEGWW